MIKKIIYGITFSLYYIILSILFLNGRINRLQVCVWQVKNT
ncbi:hypothetical protein [Polycladospora coralii]|nr:hypothetical protein [Polycladospora coralii]